MVSIVIIRAFVHLRELLFPGTKSVLPPQFGQRLVRPRERMSMRVTFKRTTQDSGKGIGHKKHKKRKKSGTMAPRKTRVESLPCPARLLV
jgi:hypothetical protein